ncbi:MAG: hypothetical protein AAFR26_08175 [Cyanobacteria bacterium J06626_4]
MRLPSDRPAQFLAGCRLANTTLVSGAKPWHSSPTQDGIWQASTDVGERVKRHPELAFEA